MSGKASADDVASLARLAAIPLMQAIQCALNKDFLLEREKREYYWAFDTKELLKGDMGSRFTAYKTALDGNFMQIDEVRYAEDLPALGMTWVKLGLQDVLYDPVTKQIYTPNTNQTSTMGELTLPSGGETPETRANPYPRNKGKFASGGGLTGGASGGTIGKTKYAPSKRRDDRDITVASKTYAKLCGVLGTRYPNAKKSDGILPVFLGNYRYNVEPDDNGGLVIWSKYKLK